MKASENCLKLIKHYESLHDGDLSKIGLQPKICPAGVVTIGYGHALFHCGKPLKDIAQALKIYPYYEIIDTAFAERLLSEDVEAVENSINSLELKLNQNQFDALVSFTFNVGLGNLLQSTLLKAIKGEVNTPIDVCFMMWVKSGGKIMKGLQYRRKTEALLYNTGKLIFYN
jgi:lysozyme